MLGITTDADIQTIIITDIDPHSCHAGLITDLIQLQFTDITEQRAGDNIFGCSAGIPVTQFQRDNCLRLIRKIAARHIEQTQFFSVCQLYRFLLFLLFDQVKIIRNKRVQCRQRETEITFRFTPFIQLSCSHCIHLIRRINEIGFFIAWFLRAGIPDAGFFRC